MNGVTKKGRGEQKVGGTRMMRKVTNEREKENFSQEFRQWVAEMKKEIESTKESEQLTKEDLAVRINAQG